jgi:hypothetical protein
MEFTPNRFGPPGCSRHRPSHYQRRHREHPGLQKRFGGWCEATLLLMGTQCPVRHVGALMYYLGVLRSHPARFLRRNRESTIEPSRPYR